MDRETFRREAARLGYELGEAEWGALGTLERLLAAGSARAALTAVHGPQGFLELHVLDSLGAVLAFDPTSPPPARLVDVGTGAGFPALPLAIALPCHRLYRGGAAAGSAVAPPQVVALESVRKKAEFVRQAVATLGLDQRVSVLQCRAELAGRDPALRERFDVALARAVAPLPVLVELALPLVRPGGWLVALKGPKAPAECVAAARAIELLGGGPPELIPVPLGARSPVLVRIGKERPTPSRYPRRPGVPRKRPLR
ncbi:MAG: ribosomal RNA small subunit methyltransferase G [Planctomycetota bacterium]|nr:MAG: ribosomal RNA small subunit methyltransferase G [Planctomycetota bacterium]